MVVRSILKTPKQRKQLFTMRTGVKSGVIRPATTTKSKF